MRFVQSFPRYQALADGQPMYSWIQANGREVNYGSLIAAFRAIRALDGIQLVEPPTITTQPADQAVMAGSPRSISPTSILFCITATLGPDPTWRQGSAGVHPYTALYNATGHPSMSVPPHWTPDDSPVGVMFFSPIRRRCDAFPIGLSTRKGTAVGQAQTTALIFFHGRSEVREGCPNFCVKPISTKKWSDVSCAIPSPVHMHEPTGGRWLHRHAGR